MSLFEWHSGKSSIFFKNRAKEFASFVHKLSNTAASGWDLIRTKYLRDHLKRQTDRISSL